MQLLPSSTAFVDYDVLLAGGLLIFWCGYWLVHLSAICYGKYKLNRKPKTEPCKPIQSPVSVEQGLPRNSPKQYPGVTILKPLVGVDPNLFVNLSSFFQMEYPTYEVLICVVDPNDPAAMVANRLLDMYPSVDARLFIGGSQVGVNPKINNVYAAYQAAKYSLILISDSSIKMKKDTLCDMVDNMADDVAIVHQIPFTCDRIDNGIEHMTSTSCDDSTDPSSFLKSSGNNGYQTLTFKKQRRFVATLEKVFFGTAHARVYLVADLVGAICHTGMSTLLRKQALEECGGLQVFAAYLAEDYFMAKWVVARGWRTTICSHPALQNNGGSDLIKFHDRLRRWVKLRIAMVPHTIILEPLSECLILGACAAWSAYTLSRGSIDPYAFYMVHVLVWFLLDWILLNVMQNGPLPFTKFEYLVAWLYREFMGPYLFLTALLWRPSVVTWTTHQYRLRWGGTSEIYDQESSSPSPDSITSTVPLAATATVTYDTTVPSNYYSTYQQQPSNGVGFTSKIKV